MIEHRWIAKAVAQKGLARVLPLYHELQKLGGRLKGFHPQSRIEYAAKLAADVSLERLLDATVVEIGTGWVPVVPMGLYLLGAREIHSFDLSRHLQPSLSERAARLLPECFDDLVRRSGASRTDIERRYAQLSDCRDWQEMTQCMRFTYHAPADVTTSNIGSVDLIYSNLVLEHVTVEALKAILGHSRRSLKAGGICWHNIDCTDHYAATHKGLSPINFLRYSDRFWSLIGQNDILYQNRLRRSDYLNAFSAAGFEVAHLIEYRLNDTTNAPVSREFRDREETDLTCGALRVVLRLL